MDFIRENRLLVIFFFLMLFLNLGLAFLVYSEHNEMQDYIDKVDQLRVQVVQLNTAKTAPVDKNLEWIKKDNVRFQNKLKNLQYVFGKPFRKAVQAYSKELKQNEFDVRAGLQSFWEKNYKKGVLTRDLVTKYLKEQVDKHGDTYTKALEEFRREAQKETLEPIGDSNVGEILFEALGVSRKMTKNYCVEFTKSMQLSVKKLLLTNTIESATSDENDDGKAKESAVNQSDTVILAKGVETFSFAKTMPVEENIAYIINHWHVVEDLTRRIKSAKIKKIENFTRDKYGLKGKRKDKYRIYNYKVVLESHMSEIRNFINSLQNAHIDNRVYVIKNIMLKKVNDQVEQMFKKTLVGDKTKKSLRKRKRVSERDAKKAPSERTNYGRVLIGKSKNIKAEIAFDYVIYIGDHLK